MKSRRFVAFAAAFSLAVSSFAGITMNAFAADETITYDFSKVTQANGFAKANTLTGSQEGFIGLTCGGVDQLASDSQSFIKLSGSKSDSQYIEFTANDTFTLVCSSAASNGSKGTLVTNTGTGVKYTTTATSTPLTLSGLAAGTYRISGTPAGSYYDVSKSMTELKSVSANAAYIGTITISYGGSAVVPEQPTTAPGATETPTQAATPQATVDPNATSEVAITRAAGWMESAYITWTNPVAVDSYNVYVRPEGGAYTKLDNELTRYYGSYYRADALGLAAGSYQFKVEAVLGGTVKQTVESDVVTVSAYKREGFAFDSHSSHYNKDGIGAYKNDGTLKDGAKVLYITDKNKNTVTMDVVVDKNKGTVNTGTGLVEILSLREKNNAETTPLAIRMIGQVEAPDGVNSAKYAQIKATSNVTFEGVGDDATTYHWSLLIRQTDNIEVRNIAVMEFYDDGISLDTDNFNDWVHNCDIFYGQNRGGDQKKGDGSLDVKAGSDYCTFSYNHFWDSGKTSLCGMKEDSYKGYHITYNYNWFDHSDSRHPRVRGDQVHVYNNYYDGVSKYGVGACTGGSVFVENNVFRNCVHPVLTSMQGRDIEGGKGTFSSEDGGSIKMFGNTIYGGVSVWYSSKNNVSSDTDAYLAETRDETVPSTYVAKQGGATYTNFDTAPSMYSYSVLDTDKVVDYVQAHAGRVQGGDFTHEFDDTVDDALYDRDDVLGNALQSYKTTLKTEYTAAAAYPATEGTQPSEKPTPAPFDPSAQPTSAPEGGGSSTEEVTSIWRASDNGASISAGAVLKADWLKLIGNGVEYKASNQTIGGVGFSGKVNAPSGQTAPTLAENGQNGAALQFIPAANGSIKVYFKLNNGKTFYITDENSTVIASHANTTGASEYTTLSTDVVENVVYYAFADGSNAEYWAAEYTYQSSYSDDAEDDPEPTQTPESTTAPAETGAPATQAPATPAPLPGTVKAVTESTVWTAASFGVDAETTYTEKTLTPDETFALNATAKLPITVDGTKRIKLTGKGREMELKAGVAGTVTVEFAHASSTATDTRTLSIVQNGTTVGSKGLTMGESGTAAATVAAGSVTITCDGGVNVTSITFTPEGGTPPELPTTKPADPTQAPTEQPDNRTCVKITATYENGVLKNVEITEDFKVTDITTPENTETTKTFYWESLESMKPVAAEAAPAEPTEKPTPEPIDTSKAVTPETVVDVTNGVVWSANDITQDTYKETINHNGLYIGADDSTDTAGKDTGAVVVESAGTSGKTVAGTKYTNRIKTGGSGNYETGVRSFYFAVSDDCTMLLDAVSSNSAQNRDVVVIHGDTVEHLTVTGTPAQFSVSLEKDENVVIFSADGGLNVYGIKLTTGAAEGGESGGTDTPSATAKQLPKDTLITFDAAAEGTGTSYTATTVFGDYLTIISNGSEMKLTANNKTIGGVDYTSRLQLGSGGSGIFNKDGSPKTKAVSVTPAVDGTITVAFASASSDVSRAVAVKQGNSGTEHSETADGNGNTISVAVTAGTPVYIYSQSEAVNVYGIILN